MSKTSLFKEILGVFKKYKITFYDRNAFEAKLKNICNRYEKKLEEEVLNQFENDFKRFTLKTNACVLTKKIFSKMFIENIVENIKIFFFKLGYKNYLIYSKDKNIYLLCHGHRFFDSKKNYDTGNRTVVIGKLQEGDELINGRKIRGNLKKESSEFILNLKLD